jgi:hypothetical protein
VVVVPEALAVDVRHEALEGRRLYSEAISERVAEHVQVSHGGETRLVQGVHERFHVVRPPLRRAHPVERQQGAPGGVGTDVVVVQNVLERLGGALRVCAGRAQGPTGVEGGLE